MLYYSSYGVLQYTGMVDMKNHILADERMRPNLG